MQPWSQATSSSAIPPPPPCAAILHHCLASLRHELRHERSKKLAVLDIIAAPQRRNIEKELHINIISCTSTHRHASALSTSAIAAGHDTICDASCMLRARLRGACAAGTNLGCSGVRDGQEHATETRGCVREATQGDLSSACGLLVALFVEINLGLELLQDGMIGVNLQH